MQRKKCASPVLPRVTADTFYITHSQNMELGNGYLPETQKLCQACIELERIRTCPKLSPVDNVVRHRNKAMKIIKEMANTESLGQKSLQVIGIPSVLPSCIAKYVSCCWTPSRRTSPFSSCIPFLVVEFASRPSSPSRRRNLPFPSKNRQRATTFIWQGISSFCTTTLSWEHCG